MIESSQVSSHQNVIEEKSEDQVIKTYARGNFIGKGQNARVYEITDTTTNQMWACKTVNKLNLSRQRQKTMFKSEISIHEQLRHQNIVQFDHVFEDSENVYVVLEL